jgi:hypothetical protein
LPLHGILQFNVLLAILEWVLVAWGMFLQEALPQSPPKEFGIIWIYGKPLGLQSNFMLLLQIA